MFTVRFINFGYNASETPATLEEALAISKKACFETAIYQGETLVASWSPIGGTRRVRKVVSQ